MTTSPLGPVAQRMLRVSRSIGIEHGANWVPLETTQGVYSTTEGLKLVSLTAANWLNGAKVLQLGIGQKATATITSANPGVVTAAISVATGDTLSFTTTGTLPSNLNPMSALSFGTASPLNTIFYPKVVNTDGTFTLAATPTGTAIDTSGGAGSGTHTLWVIRPKCSVNILALAGTDGSLPADLLGALNGRPGDNDGQGHVGGIGVSHAIFARVSVAMTAGYSMVVGGLAHDFTQ